jgi:hypothetical protein
MRCYLLKATIEIFLQFGLVYINHNMDQLYVVSLSPGGRQKLCCRSYFKIKVFVYEMMQNKQISSGKAQAFRCLSTKINNTPSSLVNEVVLDKVKYKS